MTWTKHKWLTHGKFSIRVTITLLGPIEWASYQSFTGALAIFLLIEAELEDVSWHENQMGANEPQEVQASPLPAVGGSRPGHCSPERSRARAEKWNHAPRGHPASKREEGRAELNYTHHLSVPVYQSDRLPQGQSESGGRERYGTPLRNIPPHGSQEQRSVPFSICLQV